MITTSLKNFTYSSHLNLNTMKMYAALLISHAHSWGEGGHRSRGYDVSGEFDPMERQGN